MFFKNRADAGKKLAGLLKSFKGGGTIIYALPRGGVVIGKEIAEALHAPLDLIITRKIGHPYQPEFAIGAVAENGHSVLSKEVAEIDESYITAEAEIQQEEVKRRRQVYLAGRKPVPCKNKIAILVDDGIATGLTMKAAIKELKLHYHPKKIIVAVPVAPEETVRDLQREGVELVALDIPEVFLGSIGAYYQDFSPVEDEDVIKIMREVEGYALSLKGKLKTKASKIDIIV